MVPFHLTPPPPSPAPLVRLSMPRLTKRRRSLSDAVQSVDELLRTRLVFCQEAESCECSEEEGGNSTSQPREAPSPDVSNAFPQSYVPNTSAPSTTRMQPTNSSDGATSSSCMDSCDSPAVLGASELDLLRRREEDVADMCLFLGKTVMRVGSAKSLEEMVAFIEAHGCNTVALALKLAGTQAELLHCLCTTALEGQLQCLLFRVLKVLLGHFDAEACCQEDVVRALTRALRHSDASTPLRGPLASSPTQAAPVHWSVRGGGSAKRKAKVSVDGLQEVAVAVDRLCGPPTSHQCTTIALALSMLLQLVFLGNQSAVGGKVVGSVALCFAKSGGLAVLAEMVRDRKLLNEVIPFLEVLTVSEGLAEERSGLEALFVELIDLLRPSVAGEEQQGAVLRLATNITGLDPALLAAFPDREAVLSAFITTVLLDGRADPDTVTFALCCAVNLIKWEATTGRWQFSSAFAHREKLLFDVAASMVTAHASNDVERTVLAGYYALFLGALSMVCLDGESLRIPVITAIAAAAAHGSPRVASRVAERPMTIVVAIIQEFILFQSSTGTLTKENLLEMSEMVNDLVTTNSIEVCAKKEEEGGEENESSN